MFCQTSPHALTDERIGGVVPLGDDPQLEVFHISLSQTEIKTVRKKNKTTLQHLREADAFKTRHPVLWRHFSRCDKE